MYFPQWNLVGNGKDLWAPSARKSDQAYVNISSSVLELINSLGWMDKLMELLAGVCEVGFLQGLALHVASAVALQLLLPSPAASACLGEGRLVLGRDPADCIAKIHENFMATKCLSHQYWVKVAGRATRCQRQAGRQHNLTSLLVGNTAKTSNQPFVPVS